MLAAADFDLLRDLSQRAQMAYALSCIETCVRACELRGPKYDEWLERSWRRTSAPKSEWRATPWPRNFAEIDDLLDPPVGGWGAGVSDTLGKVIDHARNSCEEILEGHNAADALGACVRELAAHGIPAPPIAPFLRSPASEMSGVGRSVPPAFFREGVEREEFARHVSNALRSADPLRRREAAAAAAKLGIGSAQLNEALADCAADHDVDVRTLADAALFALVTRDEYTALRRRQNVHREVDALRADLASERPHVRAQAIQRATEYLRDEPWLLGTVRRLFREDPDDTVRMSAIDPLRLAGAYADVLDDFLGALRDPSARVRRRAAVTIGGLPYLAPRRVDALIDVAGLPDAPLADLGYALEDFTFERRLRERLLDADARTLDTLVALFTYMPERLRTIQNAPGSLSSRPEVMLRLDAIVPISPEPEFDPQLGRPLPEADPPSTGRSPIDLVIAILAILVAVMLLLALSRITAE